MTFSDELIEITDPVYLLRYCLPDGSAPYFQKKWELDRKSVKDTSEGVYGLNLDNSMYTKGGYAEGLANKENILILLESSKEYVIYDYYGPAKAFTLANIITIVAGVRSGISSERVLNIIAPTIPKKITHEIAVIRANIIAVSKGGEFRELIGAAILNNILKGREMDAGLSGSLPDL